MGAQPKRDPNSVGRPILGPVSGPFPDFPATRFRAPRPSCRDCAPGLSFGPPAGQGRSQRLRTDPPGPVTLVSDSRPAHAEDSWLPVSERVVFAVGVPA